MISHSHRTIFVHIPKNAGQSIENMFLSDLGLSWGQRTPLLMLANNDLSIGPPRLAHLIASEYIKYHYISKELFNSYFSFSIVRNPWHRAYSFYKYLTNQIIPFSYFIKSSFYSDYFHQSSSMSWFVRPQVDYIFDDNQKLSVECIYRLEDLRDSQSDIIKRSNLPLSTQITRANISSSSRRFSLIKRLPIIGTNIGRCI